MIPSMTNAAAHRALETLGREWTGRGVAVECGCWLGASSVALLRGLVAAGYDRPFYGFDRWAANDSEVAKAADQGMTLAVGQDISTEWVMNALLVYPKLRARRGNLGAMRWDGGPVEVLVLDAAKREPIFSHVMGEFVPSLVDGASVVLLDYGYWRRFEGAQADALRCQERWVVAHEGFEYLAPVGEVGAWFRYREGGK